jgi:hypothetical protein
LILKCVGGTSLGKKYKLDGQHIVFGAEDKADMRVLSGTFGI